MKSRTSALQSSPSGSFPLSSHLPCQGPSVWMRVMMCPEEEVLVPAFSGFLKLSGCGPHEWAQDRRAYMSLPPWNFSHGLSCQGTLPCSVSVECDVHSKVLFSGFQVWFWADSENCLKLDIDQWLFCWWWCYLLSLRRNKCS